MPVATTAATRTVAEAAQLCPCGCSPARRRCPSPLVLKYGDWNSTFSPSPDSSFLHQRKRRASLSSRLTFPLAPYILVGGNCFFRIIFSYLSGGNVSGHYLTLQAGICRKSDLSISSLFRGPKRVSQWDKWKETHAHAQERGGEGKGAGEGWGREGSSEEREGGRGERQRERGEGGRIWMNTDYVR